MELVYRKPAGDSVVLYNPQLQRQFYNVKVPTECPEGFNSLDIIIEKAIIDRLGGVDQIFAFSVPTCLGIINGIAPPLLLTKSDLESNWSVTAKNTHKIAAKTQFNQTEMTQLLKTAATKLFAIILTRTSEKQPSPNIASSACSLKHLWQNMLDSPQPNPDHLEWAVIHTIDELHSAKWTCSIQGPQEDSISVTELLSDYSAIWFSPIVVADDISAPLDTEARYSICVDTESLRAQIKASKSSSERLELLLKFITSHQSNKTSLLNPKTERLRAESPSSPAESLNSTVVNPAISASLSKLSRTAASVLSEDSYMTNSSAIPEVFLSNEDDPNAKVSPLITNKKLVGSISPDIPSGVRGFSLMKDKQGNANEKVYFDSNSNVKDNNSAEDLRDITSPQRRVQQPMTVVPGPVLWDSDDKATLLASPLRKASLNGGSPVTSPHRGQLDYLQQEAKCKMLTEALSAANSREEQAKSFAEELRRLLKERSVEISYLREMVDASAEETKHVKNRLATLTRTLEETESMYQEKVSKLNGSFLEMQNMRNETLLELEQKKREISELNHKLAQQRDNAQIHAEKDLVAKQQDLARRTAELAAEESRLQEKMDSFRKALEVEKDDFVSQKQEHDAKIRCDFEELELERSKFDQLKADFERRSAQLVAREDELTAKEEFLAEKEAKFSSISDLDVSLRDENKVLKSRLETREREVADLTEKYTASKQEIEVLTEQKAKLDEKITQAVSDLQAEKENLRNFDQAKQKVISDLSSQLEKHQLREQELTQELEVVESKLKAFNDVSLKKQQAIQEEADLKVKQLLLKLERIEYTVESKTNDLKQSQERLHQVEVQSVAFFDSVKALTNCSDAENTTDLLDALKQQRSQHDSEAQAIRELKSKLETLGVVDPVAGIESMDQSVKRLSSENTRLTELVEKSLNESQTLTQQLGSKEQALLDLTAENTRLKDELEAKKMSTIQVWKELDQTRNELERVRVELSELRVNNRETKPAEDGASNTVSRRRTSDLLHRAQSTLSKTIEVVHKTQGSSSTEHEVESIAEKPVNNEVKSPVANMATIAVGNDEKLAETLVKLSADVAQIVLWLSTEKDKSKPSTNDHGYHTTPDFKMPRLDENPHRARSVSPERYYNSSSIRHGRSHQRSPESLTASLHRSSPQDRIPSPSAKPGGINSPYNRDGSLSPMHSRPQSSELLFSKVRSTQPGHDYYAADNRGRMEVGRDEEGIADLTSASLELERTMELLVQARRNYHEGSPVIFERVDNSNTSYRGSPVRREERNLWPSLSPGGQAHEYMVYRHYQS